MSKIKLSVSATFSFEGVGVSVTHHFDGLLDKASKQAIFNECCEDFLWKCLLKIAETSKTREKDFKALYEHQFEFDGMKFSAKDLGESIYSDFMTDTETKLTLFNHAVNDYRSGQGSKNLTLNQNIYLIRKGRF